MVAGVREEVWKCNRQRRPGELYHLDGLLQGLLPKHWPTIRVCPYMLYGSENDEIGRFSNSKMAVGPWDPMGRSPVPWRQGGSIPGLSQQISLPAPWHQTFPTLASGENGPQVKTDMKALHGLAMFPFFPHLPIINFHRSVQSHWKAAFPFLYALMVTTSLICVQALPEQHPNRRPSHHRKGNVVIQHGRAFHRHGASSRCCLVRPGFRTSCITTLVLYVANPTVY